MRRFTKFTDAEIERRRKISVEEIQRRDRMQFDAWYQKRCDEIYWRGGKCCAGCDHWESDSSLHGICKASPILSGEDVMRSLGISWSSTKFSPGRPFTRATNHCGMFKDDFDWSTLDEDYLRQIGAMDGDSIKPKPITAHEEAEEARG